MKPVGSLGLKHKALELGFGNVGICDAVPSEHLANYESWLDKGFHGSMDYLVRHVPLKADPGLLLASAQSVVAVALNYGQPNPLKPGYPRIATYALGRDYHKVLRGKLRSLEAWLRREHPGIETLACVDSAPILEREYAHLAGLGWFGKNTMLIDSRRGSWFFIGLLLSSIRFEPDQPAVGGCGTCRACIEACPTGAIVQQEGRWQVDARRCISYLTIEHKGPIEPELEAKIGDWTFGCDVCQDVCPFNAQRESQPERASNTFEADFLKPREWPSLEQLAQISHDGWDELSRGSAVRRAGWEGLKRNARINFENSRFSKSLEAQNP